MKARKRRRVAPNGRSAPDRYFIFAYQMALSPAWRSLSGRAAKVWIELRCCYNGGNNGKLALSMGKAAELLGMSKSTAQAALAELEEKGFITMTKRGAFYGRLANTYAVTDQGREGAAPTNQWKHWRPAKDSNPPRWTVPQPNQKTDSGTDTEP